LIYRQAAQTNELPVVVLRLFHVYGPWESSHRLGPTAICASFSGNTIKLTESGIRRDWIFIDDVCEALILAVDKGSNGDVINIGTGKETSNEGIVACIESITGRHINLAEGFYPRRITDLEHRFADFSLARKQLGWQPRHNLKIGFSRTIDWYLANSQAWSNPYDKKYTVV
jgi:nucleoside-diphosphate-sugar epimerase